MERRRSRWLEWWNTLALACAIAWIVLILAAWLAPLLGIPWGWWGNEPIPMDVGPARGAWPEEPQWF